MGSRFICTPPPYKIHKAVGLSEVGDEAERRAAQNLKMRKKMVRCDEKRNLKQEREQSAQGIEWAVVVFAVVGLEHHEALVALERLFYPVHPVGESFLRVALLLLHRVRPAVERQRKEADCHAHPNDGNSLVRLAAPHKAEQQLEHNLHH